MGFVQENIERTIFFAQENIERIIFFVQENIGRQIYVTTFHIGYWDLFAQKNIGRKYLRYNIPVPQDFIAILRFWDIEICSGKYWRKYIFQFRTGAHLHSPACVRA